MIDWIQSFSQILQSLQLQNNFDQINAQHLGYSSIALIWYTILWLKYISYISVNKWLREGSMSNPPPLITRSDDGDSDDGKGRIKLSFIMYKIGKSKLIYYLSVCFVFAFYMKVLYSKQATTTCMSRTKLLSL